MKVTIPFEIDESEILSAVFDNLWTQSSPWVSEYSYGGGVDEIVPVTYENPDEDGYLTKQVSRLMLVEAYKNLLTDGLFHCGTPVPSDMDEWDACCSDYVLQYALFGELVYG